MLGSGSTPVPARAAATALALLTAFGSLALAGTAPAAPPGKSPRRMTIQVYENDQKTPTVVVTVPLSLATAALRIASHGGAHVVLSDDDGDRRCAGHDIDPEALLRAIEESGPGTLLEVRDHAQRVEIRLD